MIRKIWRAPNGWITQRLLASKDSVKVADQIMKEKNLTWSDLWFLMRAYHFRKWNRTKILLVISITSLINSAAALLLKIL